MFFPSLKNLLIIIFFIFTSTVFFLSITRQQALFQEREKAINLLETLKYNETLFKEKIHKSEKELYFDYNQINNVQTTLEETLDKLEHQINDLEYDNVASSLQIYRSLVNQRYKKLETYKGINGIIKNAFSIIPTMLHGFDTTGKITKSSQYNNILKLMTSLFLAKNTFDITLLGQLQTLNIDMTNHPDVLFDDPVKNTQIKMQLNILTENFQNYVLLYTNLIDEKPLQIIQEMTERFEETITADLAMIKNLFSGFFILFIVAIILTIFFLFRLEQDKLKISRLQEKLLKDTSTDPLTGLENRYKLNRILSQGEPLALILLNIDRFSRVNSHYGVECGNTVLKEYTNILLKTCKCLQERKGTYRISADEFVMVFPKKDRQYYEKLCKCILERINNHIFKYKEIELHITASITVSDQYPLLTTAEQIMKQVKMNSRTNYMIFEQNMIDQSVIEKNIKAIQRVRYALKNDMIVLHYQPIVSNITGAVTKYETLVRIKDEEGTLYYPGSFLDAVQEVKLYPELTRKIISTSLGFFENRIEDISLNLSIEDILDADMKEFIYNLLDQKAHMVQRITFEILETEQIDNSNEVAEFIQQIQAKGAKIAIDDFGAGYSNYERLLNLKVNYLKIDGSLIEGIHTNENAHKVVKTIVDFAKEIGIETIAEFVSSEEIHFVVKSLGINYSQGFHTGRPTEL